MTRRAGLLLLAACLAAGCHGPLRPPEVVQPHDPFPDYPDSPAGQPSELPPYQALEELQARTDALYQQLGAIEKQLHERNEELRKTREANQQVLKEVATIQQQWDQWRQEMHALEGRLDQRESQRLEVLDEFAKRLRDAVSRTGAE